MALLLARTSLASLDGECSNLLRYTLSSEASLLSQIKYGRYMKVQTYYKEWHCAYAVGTKSHELVQTILIISFSFPLFVLAKTILNMHVKLDFKLRNYSQRRLRAHKSYQ